MFNKILIANRGEIAARITRACHELGIYVVAVFSDADANALHTRLADEAVHIGGPTLADSYLRGERLIAAALETGCEAIHPGFGFLSESPEFAQAVTDTGLIFIGPSADTIYKMGIKTEARSIMQTAGVPVVPGFQSDDATDADFQQAADKIGYPVMVKAAGGGGGKGIRIVHNRADLLDSIAAARREAQNAFGDSTVFLEKYIDHGRHIEFQVLADKFGSTVHLFERECSIQRRHQKIIEETPSPLLNEQTRQEMGQAAVAAAQAVHYANAGTVEFIVAETGEFYFLEMNTRLQVEHPITELVTGIDIVKMQIQIAAGERLPFTQDDIYQRGHAIECRVYAEDPANNFLPAIGPVLRTIEPAGPGVRVDAGVVSGDEVTIYYDPMIAKLIVYAESRPDAIRKMDWALAQYVILGLTTNLQFLRDVILHPAFVMGETNTHFIDEFLTPWHPPQAVLPDEALIVAALSDLLIPAGQPTLQSIGENGDGDLYSPWSRADSFRMGQPT
ncbi:MAG: acetyl-CoA carboxylase biotin carboxylase subunit [Chloroflexi bacterium]|nr:acetyl-CoA carboxylase biotin carboxylase subunit [Chloroflexota bacterium]